MVSLDGTWKLRAEFIDVAAERFNEMLSREDGKFDVIFFRGKVMPAKKGFMDANVPCDILTPLIESGIIDEPLVGKNTENCKWTKDLSWWFTRDFEVDETLFANEQVRLFIEILDFKADIIINGVPVYKHSNAFCAFDENVKHHLKIGKNQIIIRLTGGLEDYYYADSLTYYSFAGRIETDQRAYLRKPAFTFGWDWCKQVHSCGIGGKVYLEGVSGAKISHFRADTVCIDGNDAKVKLIFELDNISVVTADDAVLKYSIAHNGTVVFEGEMELYLAGGINNFEETITVSDAKLWWPNGYGDANLYAVNASLECRGVSNTMEEKLVGIRTIKIDHSKRSDGTRNFRFVVNGVNVFCKGGNWVGTDSIYIRTPDSKYKTLVEEAKEQNFNMLRVWGGGRYEPDYFYDYCSQNGIMLMHDFMFSNVMFPDYSAEFMREAEKEATYQTRRLSNQACMAVWTGNNEVHESYEWLRPGEEIPYNYGYKIFNYLLPKAVRDNSPLIQYMPSSPFYGDKANDTKAGDVHAWGLFSIISEKVGLTVEQLKERGRRHEDYDALAAMIRFSSEFGFHGTLMKSSVERYHNGEEVGFESESWRHHEGENKRGLLPGIDANLTSADSLDMDDFLLYGGILQGVNYTEVAEALRRTEQCSGDLIWMYNDAWPECGWTTVDYYLTRKISFYFLRRAFAPKKIIVRVFNGKYFITVLNETGHDLNVEMEYGYMSFDGKTVDVKTMPLSLKKHSFNEIEGFDASENLKTGFYFAKILNDGGFDSATSLRGYYRSYDFAEFKAEIVSDVQDGNDRLVTVRAKTYVPFVQIVCEDDRVKLSDNFFALLPGEEKSLRVYDCTEAVSLRLVSVNK